MFVCGSEIWKKFPRRKCSAFCSVSQWQLVNISVAITTVNIYFTKNVSKLKCTQMSRGAKHRHVSNFRRSYSSEDEPEPSVSEVSETLDPQLEPADLQLRTRTGPRLWWSVGLSVLGSAAAMAAAGCLCALTYPILKGMRVPARVAARATGLVKPKYYFEIHIYNFRKKYFITINTLIL